MKRQDALRVLKFAGYHGDTKTLIRVYVEERVSYDAAQDAYGEGKQMKANGMKCNCRDCNAAK